MLALLGACGEPPQPQPTSPTYATASSGPIPLDPSLLPSLPPGLTPPAPAPTPATGYPTYPGYPANPGLPANPGYPYPPRTATPAPTTTAPTTKSPTPTPSHAGRCTAEPTGPQILALVKGKPGVPDRPLRVDQGPFCSGTWSFTTVEVRGANEDQLEPLMVVATGNGASLTLVAAGSDVCIGPVETGAPPGIRVLACGF